MSMFGRWSTSFAFLALPLSVACGGESQHTPSVGGSPDQSSTGGVGRTARGPRPIASTAGATSTAAGTAQTGEADSVFLEQNRLNCATQAADLTAMKARGIQVSSDCP